jgi:hypothetical protein
MQFLHKRSIKTTNLLLSTLFVASIISLTTPTPAHSQGMDFGNMSMPSPGNWLPSSTDDWSNNNGQRGGPPPPQWSRNGQQGNGSNSWQNSRQQQRPPKWMGNNQGQQQGNQANRGSSQRNRRQSPSSQQLKKLQTLLHLTPEQEGPWSEYTASLSSKQSIKRPSNTGNNEPKSYVEQSEQRIQRMEQMLNARKAKLAAHKNFMASLDEKQLVIFNLLSQQFQQRRNSGQRGQRGRR